MFTMNFPDNHHEAPAGITCPVFIDSQYRLRDSDTGYFISEDAARRLMEEYLESEDRTIFNREIRERLDMV